MTNNNKWAGLSQSEKAQLISIYTKYGYTNLSDITNHYNKFAPGGDFDGEEEYFDVINPSVVTATLPSINTKQGERIAKNIAYRVANGEVSLSNVPRKYYNYVQGEVKGAIPATKAINDAGENIYNAVDTVTAFMPGTVGTINWLAHMGADVANGDYGKVAGDIVMAALMGKGVKLAGKGLNKVYPVVANKISKYIKNNLKQKSNNNKINNIRNNNDGSIYAAFLPSAPETEESKKLNQIALDFFDEVTKPRFLKENEEVFKDIKLFRKGNKKIEVDDVKKYKIGENVGGFHQDGSGRNVIDKNYSKKESAAIHEAVSHGTDNFVSKEQQKMYEDALKKLDSYYFNNPDSGDWRELRATKNELIKHLIDNNIDINSVSEWELSNLIKKINGYGRDYFNAILKGKPENNQAFLDFLKYSVTTLPVAAGSYVLLNNSDNSLDIENKFGGYLNNYI